MSDDFSAIERSLLRRRDGDEAASPSSLKAEASAAVADIGAILEAVQLTATSITSMADRIEELEAHTEAFAASNAELETENRRLTIEIGDAIQQCDTLGASLDAETERLKRLEGVTAEHVARATSLERDVAAAHADLERIVDAVGGHLGEIGAPARPEDSTAA